MIFHFLGFKMKFINSLLLRCIVILLPILSLRNVVSSTTFLVLINLLCDGESEAKIPNIFLNNHYFKPSSPYKLRTDRRFFFKFWLEGLSECVLARSKFLKQKQVVMD